MAKSKLTPKAKAPVVPVVDDVDKAIDDAMADEGATTQPVSEAATYDEKPPVDEIEDTNDGPEPVETPNLVRHTFKDKLGNIVHRQERHVPPGTPIPAAVRPKGLDIGVYTLTEQFTGSDEVEPHEKTSTYNLS